MKAAVIGGGYVGLVSGACFAEFGNEVHVVEADQTKLDMLLQGQIPIHEPGLDKLIAKNVAAGQLSFTADLQAAVTRAEAIFIAVGTPSRKSDGHPDMSYVYAAVEQMAPYVGMGVDNMVVVTKSTVPVGTGRKIAKILQDLRPGFEFDVASNPEFLREGCAIEDFMRPDRVVIGTSSGRARMILRRLYAPLEQHGVPIIFTGLETAEVTKYAANTFLAMKISFINEVADLCEQIGADALDIARGIGLDHRIGKEFLQPGPGFGGSCFPKDTLALMRTAQDAGTPLRLTETVVSVNDARKASMGARIIRACGGSARGQTIAVLGLAFKPDTDDMRDAPSVALIHRLVEEGAQVKAYDPVAMKQAATVLPRRVQYCPNWGSAVSDADAVIIVTEWTEFRAIDPEQLRCLMRGSTVIDLRNIFEPTAMVGLDYYPVGRPATGYATQFAAPPLALELEAAE